SLHVERDHAHCAVGDRARPGRCWKNEVPRPVVAGSGRHPTGGARTRPTVADTKPLADFPGPARIRHPTTSGGPLPVLATRPCLPSPDAAGLCISTNHHL